MNERDMAHTPPPGHPLQEAIPAYALGVLDPSEQAALEDHLATCHACRAELSRYEDVVGGLGYRAAPVPPRPDLRAALLAEIADDARDASVDAPRPLLVPARWLAVAAVLAIAAIAVLGYFLNQTLQERDDARYVEEEIAEYLANGGVLSALRPAPGAAPDVVAGNGALAIAPDQSGAMLIVYGLPPTTDDLRYTAWAERDGERVSLGDLVVNEHGVGSLKLYGPDPIVSYETIGITRITPAAPDGEPFLLAPVE